MLLKLDELLALRDRLKAELNELRTALNNGLAECAMDGPVPPELFDAFSRMMFIDSHLQDVEDAISVSLTH